MSRGWCGVVEGEKVEIEEGAWRIPPGVATAPRDPTIAPSSLFSTFLSLFPTTTRMSPTATDSNEVLFQFCD